MRLQRLFKIPQSVPQGLLTSSVSSFAIKFASTLLAFAITVVLARALGPDDYGVFAFAFSIALILGLPAHIGIPKLLIREVARYESMESWGLLRGIARRAQQSVALLSLLVMVAGAASVLLIRPDNVAVLLWAFTLVPALSIMRTQESVLRGLRHPIIGQIPEMLLRPTIHLTVVGLLFATEALSASTAMSGYTISAVSALLIGTILVRRFFPTPAKKALPQFDTKTWARSVVPFALMGGMTILNTRVDIIMLGALSTTTEVGLYRVASQLAVLVAFALSAVNSLLAPGGCSPTSIGRFAAAAAAH